MSSQTLKQRVLAIALLLLTIAIGIAFGRGLIRANLFPIAIAASILFLFAIVSLVVASCSNDGKFFALNWFLPFLKKDRSGRQPAFLLRIARCIFPKSWFADRVKGKPGRFRRLLKWIGPSVHSSPLRRCIQTLSLIIFLFLFLWVCWPYHARPVGEGNTSREWKFSGIDQDVGDLRFEVSAFRDTDSWLQKGDSVFLNEQASATAVVERNAIVSIACTISDIERSDIKQLDNKNRLSAPSGSALPDSANFDDAQSDSENSGAENSNSDNAQSSSNPFGLPQTSTAATNRNREPVEVVSITLAPVDELTETQFDRLFGSTNLWELRNRDRNEWPSHYTDNLANKEFLPAESFLTVDPLVSLSTAIASRSWIWSLVCAAAILIVSVFVPRGFCGYLCPLGTVIDLFDWTVTRRFKKLRVADEGWWVHIKYYLLTATLISALLGVLVSGFVSAIPVITRALLFLIEPLQIGIMRDWHQVAPMHWGHWLSIALFALVLMLGFLRARFWCKYVCPSGALFSIGNLLRVTERKVESSCINCNRCVDICPFDAIKPDFTTRVTDCTLCQSCGGVCPTHAIKFVERWNLVELKTENDPPTNETAIGRRGLLSLIAGSSAALVGGVAIASAAKLSASSASEALLPVRPPGSIPEEDFLQACIRCGECFKVCPNNVLQAEGFQQGINGLWAPMVNANWAGCESSCNACGQVCPTGAIRALPLAEKRVAKMGLAIVDQKTCLPLAGKEECQLCVDECNAAGYRAIEFTQVHTQTDEAGQPIPDSGFLAPVVVAERCVGCGLCQTRCNAINVKEKKLLKESAIIVEAGIGKEDRIKTGSYQKLRAAELEKRERASASTTKDAEYFVPDSIESSLETGAGKNKPATKDEVNERETKEPGIPNEDAIDDDPFGLN